MTRINRASTYSGEEPPAISVKTIEQVIREQGGQQLPPGSVPEDRVAPSTTDGDVQVTEQGKTQWTASENLSGVITARLEAAAAQAASIPKSIGDAKGDLVGFSAADTPVRIAAASGDGYGLISDTSQTGGVAWELRGAYRSIDTNVGRGAGAGTSIVYLPRDRTVVFFSAAGSAGALFYINVPDHATTTTPSFKAKLRAWVLTEADPTDSNVTVTLFRATSIGATGTLSGSSTIGTATVSGVNAATSLYTGESSDLTISTSGWYFVGFQHSSTPGTTLTYGYTLLAKCRP